jgi:uncharacterized protein YdhG (YjbR/CyaY superfamily)
MPFTPFGVELPEWVLITLTTATIADRLTKYNYSKGVIRLQIEKPIDYEYITNITYWRVD